MDFIVTVMEVLFVILIACVIVYTHKTNSIIKDQEKQIARQNTEIFRLQAKLHRATCRKSPEVIEIHDDRVDPDNVPNFEKDW